MAELHGQMLKSVTQLMKTRNKENEELNNLLLIFNYLLYHLNINTYMQVHFGGA